MTTQCTHLDEIRDVMPNSIGCEDCLKTGDEWVHLRLCETCGHVGCCDDSKNKHATEHFHATAHPVIRSLEPGEDWRWCYVDEVISTPESVGDDEEANGRRVEHRKDDSLVRQATPDNGVASSRNISSGIDLTRARQNAGGNKGMFKTICGKVRRCNRENLEPVIELAVEIAREGREGRRIGTLFTFGDSEAVLARSRPLILDPLAGHADEAKNIRDQNLRGTIKELAQLDGAFVISDDGIVVSACRYLDAMASDVVLPFGLGSRHVAGGSISQVTDAVAIVVSESSMVRVFDDGKMVAEIIPELWLMDRHNVQLRAPYREELQGDLAVLIAES
jgi:DNA integrity scanning protein DisA with diadenylate cyclase activity